MTNVVMDNIAGSSKQYSAFNTNISKHEFWYLSPPTVHMLASVTGGLKNIYENIGRCLSGEQEHSHQRGMDKCNYTTDENGHFTPLEETGRMAKRYEYVQILNFGRTAVVIQAKDTFMQNKLVAIKILHDHNYLVGGQEADIHRQIQRANLHRKIPILPLLNTFRMDEHYCLVFNYCNPLPITRYFHNQGWNGKDCIETITKVASRTLHVLNFLRELNIIHADLKPENLLLDNGAEVCVIDFGNSFRCTPEEIGLYEDDYDLQTIPYRAPEVIVGVEIGFAADLWSVGCILAELYLGHQLFCSETPAALMQSIVNLLGLLPQQYLCGKFSREYEHLIDHSSSSSSDEAAQLQLHLQCNDNDFINIIRSLLQLVPENRIRACSILHNKLTKT